MLFSVTAHCLLGETGGRGQGDGDRGWDGLTHEGVVISVGTPSDEH